jgi:hypothetical protein
MSLTLELPPELEAEVRSAAAREGVAPESFAVNAIEERLRGGESGERPKSESELLEAIGAGLPAATWQRYHALLARRRAGTIPDDDYAELLRLTDEVELWNARRLELVARLAQLKGVPLRQLVERMGLAARLDA